jgi:hypothetical protein
LRVGVLLDDLFCEAHVINTSNSPAIIDPHVSVVRPTKRLEPLAKRRGVPLPFFIIRTPHQNCDLGQLSTLLRAPRGAM